MNTLDEAWDWYESAERQFRLLRRLGRRHWDSLPWDGPLGQDARLREVGADDLVRDADCCLAPLDDLAIVVLFSVFEAEVRGRVLSAIEGKAVGLRHPALRRAADLARDAVEVGSFFQVLEPYKGDGHADAIEQVNQARRYRNWVAHGRRGDMPPAVRPDVAYRRLRSFLELVEPADRPPA